MQSQITDLISGIQQVGIGVPDAEAAFKWYNKNLGLDVPVFDDVAEAKLMTKYTVGNIRQRRAILAVNMAGGGGAEIWESKRPLPLAAKTEPEIGDLGIYAVKIKCQDIAKYAQTSGNTVVNTPEGKPSVWLKDLYGNQLQVVEDGSWFKPALSNTGGVLGAIIGVSDMEKALKLYKDTLGINEVIYDVTGTFEDFKALGAGQKRFRRVVLKKEKSESGAFTNLFGNIAIELVQALDGKPNVIFEGRSWGDLGYIHLCFDAIDMEKLKEKCENNGFQFVVDSSNTFDMGEAGGRFSYIEDPDGTLIEFVETHKVPILKKIGWYLNLKKRKTQKPLPNWMVSTLGWGRVKL
ncbi:VOC family protein [Emticicia sp. CRIBPO]|uniref:VOC family protein n=1 Tax=Emticicia sp. CRIBPO TaxID=2683258 RepID=UPI00197AD1B3|nr:VOC family protein [Emticicia sp. CRIBPO]